MDFWMDDDEAPESQSATQLPTTSGNTSQKSQSQKTARREKENGFVCVNCGSTEFYHDDAISKDVCAACFTQSDKVAEDMNLEEVLAMGAQKSGAGGARGIKTSMAPGIHKPKLSGASGRPRIHLKDNSSRPPELSTCLHGMKVVLQKCLSILLDDILRLSAEESQSAKDVAKHLFISFVENWGHGAEHYAKKFPEIRFSLRDLFLSPVYRRAVHLVLLEKALKGSEEKGDDEQQNDKDSDENDDEASNGDINDKRKFAPPVELLQRAVRHTEGPEHSNGCLGHMEAALCIRPDVVMVAAILWLAVARRGICWYHIAAWITREILPLQDAFSKLLSKKQQQKLRSARSAFVMRNFPHSAVIEQVASLLLISGRVKSLEAFASAGTPAKMPFATFAGFPVRLVPVEVVPLVTAQLVADIGLGQPVLNTALALFGRPPFQMQHRKRIPRLRDLHVVDMKSMRHVAAVVVCAVVLQNDWRKLVVVERRREEEYANKKTLARTAQVPCTENDFRLMTNKSFGEYVKFCEETFNKDENSGSVLLDDLVEESGGSWLEIDEGGNDDKDDRRERKDLHSPVKRSFVAGVSSGERHPDMPTQLWHRIHHRLTRSSPPEKAKVRRRKKGTLPSLDTHETLLLEFMAYTTRSRLDAIRRALADILGYRSI